MHRFCRQGATASLSSARRCSSPRAGHGGWQYPDDGPTTGRRHFSSSPLVWKGQIALAPAGEHFGPWSWDERSAGGRLVTPVA